MAAPRWLLWRDARLLIEGVKMLMYLCINDSLYLEEGYKNAN